MTLTPRLPPHLEQEPIEYCAKRRLAKSKAVKLALKEVLRVPKAGAPESRYPFIGADKGDGSDVSANIKLALRARFRGYARTRPAPRKAAHSSGDHS